MNNTILLVEIADMDKPGQVARLLTAAGYAYTRTCSAVMAFAELEINEHPLIAVDLSDAKDQGARLVRGLHVASPQSTIIAFSRDMDTRYILDLLRAGAWDCQVLPIEFERLDNVIFQALKNERPRTNRGDELRHVLYYDGSMPKDANPMHSFCLQVLGGEQYLSAIKKTIVTIQGECGTGKHVVAETLHRLSAQPNGRMVRIDVSETQGAAGESGSLLNRLNHALPLASEGTLLLEDVHRLSMAQAESICTLLAPYNCDDMSVVGDSSPRRVILTYGPYTRGEARSEGIIDLLHRSLHPAEIQLPSLRSHPEYIPDLVGQYLAYCRMHMHIPIRGVDSHAMRSLLFHHWPGNLRELASVLEGATVLCNGHHLQLEHLPSQLHRIDGVDLPTYLNDDNASFPAR